MISMRPARKLLLLVVVGLSVHQLLLAQKPDDRLKQKGMSGNPVFEGWYADPEAIVYGSEYLDLPHLLRGLRHDGGSARSGEADAAAEARDQQAVP